VFCPVACSGRDSFGPSKKLFVSNLNYETEVDTLQELFPDANDVYLPKNRETGEKRGFVTRERAGWGCGVYWTG